jgi:hypothetical protein
VETEDQFQSGKFQKAIITKAAMVPFRLVEDNWFRKIGRQYLSTSNSGVFQVPTCSIHWEKFSQPRPARLPCKCQIAGSIPARGWILS